MGNETRGNCMATIIRAKNASVVSLLLPEANYPSRKLRAHLTTLITSQKQNKRSTSTLHCLLNLCFMFLFYKMTKKVLVFLTLNSSIFPWRNSLLRARFSITQTLTTNSMTYGNRRFNVKFIEALR